VRIRQGELAEAVRQFAGTLNLLIGPGDQLDRFVRGLQLLREGRYPDGLAMFDEAARRDPAQAKSYRQLGALLVRYGR
jgi:tetratricopeptide (TPR) repeat protein